MPLFSRILRMGQRNRTDKVAVDGSNGPGANVAKVTSKGFNCSGLDFHTAGTLAKNFSFYVLTSSDEFGSLHFESVWARLDNLAGGPWLNIKLGKFELDNPLSEKRFLTLISVGGNCQNYHLQPFAQPGVAEIYTFGIGDNQASLEWMGHSANDGTRVSASLLTSNDGQPDVPGGGTYDGSFAASQAFERFAARRWLCIYRASAHIVPIQPDHNDSGRHRRQERAGNEHNHRRHSGHRRREQGLPALRADRTVVYQEFRYHHDLFPWPRQWLAGYEHRCRSGRRAARWGTCANLEWRALREPLGVQYAAHLHRPLRTGAHVVASVQHQHRQPRQRGRSDHRVSLQPVLESAGGLRVPRRVLHHLAEGRVSGHLYQPDRERFAWRLGLDV